MFLCQRWLRADIYIFYDPLSIEAFYFPLPSVALSSRTVR